MALVISSSPRTSSFRGDRNKPWMLKDFLLDDLGSCSSSGFRSFPRRQCCAAAVRNLIEMEVRSRNSASRRLFKSSSSASSKISSAIHRASISVISAVKLLPFRSAPANPKAIPSNKSVVKKKSLLPRSFSKRLFRKSLWKKATDDRSIDCEIERWISSGAASVEKYQPSDLSNATTTITVTSASTTSSTNSDGWSESDSEFTQPRSSVDENGFVERKERSSAKSKRRVSDADESIGAVTKTNWNCEGEKEQSSPISVLNFPDEDEETGSSSPFTRKLTRLEGTKEKLMQKLRRFECLSRIGKINLEARLSLQSIPSPLHSTTISPIKEEETEEKAVQRLLNHVKAKTTSSNIHMFNADALLIGFFEEGLAKASGNNYKLVEDTLLSEAEDWLCGRSHNEVSLGWKVKEKRKVYVNDIEESREWRCNVHDLEKEEMVVQVEADVLASLVDEMVGEFSNLELLNFLLK